MNENKTENKNFSSSCLEVASQRRRNFKGKYKTSYRLDVISIKIAKGNIWSRNYTTIKKYSLFCLNSKSTQPATNATIENSSWFFREGTEIQITTSKRVSSKRTPSIFVFVTEKSVNRKII